MTAVTRTTEDLLARIHETGYWRVLIHPTAYDARRLPTPSERWRIVEESQVRLRPWGYPQVEADYRLDGDGWIQSGGDHAGQFDLWRFYRSGQFVHHFSVAEDRLSSWPAWSGNGKDRTAGGPRLNLVNTLYTLTEMFLFARGLAYRGVLDPAAVVRVELYGMKDRQLGLVNDEFPPDLVSDVDSISWEQTYVAMALLTEAPKLAVDAAVHIFRHFKWDEPSRRLLHEYQQRLLQRRL